MARTKTQRRAKKELTDKTQRAAKVIAKIERRGGPRIGAGRPPGPQKMARRLISIRDMTQNIIREGKVPLRVMINNMIYYDEKAAELDAQLADMIAQIKNPDDLIKALELYAQASDTRMKAQKCAVDAAPFLHPRLSQMQLNVNNNASPRDLADDADIGKYRDDFNALRGQTLDNETGAPVDEESDQ